MGRTRTVEDAELLDAAVRVISRVGPARLSLSAIAREAGVAAPTLVQRFGSKRGLLLAIARRGVSFGERLRSHLGSGEPVKGAVVEAIVEMAGFARTPVELANHLAFLEMDLADPEFQAIAQTQHANWFGTVEDALRGALERGELSGDAARIARWLRITFDGTLIGWALEGGSKPLQEVLRQNLVEVLAAHSAPAPRPDGPGEGSRA